MNGIIIIDKPQDFTSFDVVAVMRRLTKQKKIGHMGTLDPMATGVLPILLGNATKAQNFITDHDKEYIAGFQLGITTDTLDITGKEQSRCKPSVTKKQMQEVLIAFLGEITQVPPMFSAIQKNGQRLYDLARQGIVVERDARFVTIYESELLDFDELAFSG
ncbi:MAG: tRNA pseudouridine(55) synthase TruB, partial [Bacillota bacterium]|nr:tRNA pseudouridine(55) synthase TruB [Bacillota bacterium]